MISRRLPSFAECVLLLLAFGASPTLRAQLLINELDSDQTGNDTGEFVEIVNAGISGVPLSGVSLVFYNGNGDVSYFALDLSPGVTLAPGDHYVVGNPGVPNVAQTFDPGTVGLLQNGPDAVALFNAPASAFPNGTPITTTNLLDAVVYDTADADDAGLLALLNAGQPQIDENGSGTGITSSIGRFLDASGGARNTDTYAVMPPTPGLINIPEPTTLGLLAIGSAALLACRRGRP